MIDQELLVDEQSPEEGSVMHHSHDKGQIAVAEGPETDRSTQPNFLRLIQAVRQAMRV